MDKFPLSNLSRTRLLTAGLLVSAAAGFLGWWFWGRGTSPEPIVLEPALPAPDPRLSYQGPFQNVHPQTEYVSDALCATCHAKIARKYSQHPMARTLTPIAQLPAPPLGQGANLPFEAFGQQFQVRAAGGQMFHERRSPDDPRGWIFEQEKEIHYAIGSGAHAHSFFSVSAAGVVQSPITWYSQKKLWDLSPGFGPHILGGRRIGGDCFFCHSNGASTDPRDDTAYREPVFPNGHGIGCQRCHGPGGAHVKNPGVVEMGSDYLDPTIVNPAHLTPPLREAVCWQCHLEGQMRVLRRGRTQFDFRPGMPLEDFVGIYQDVAHTNFDDIVNHVEQMTHSVCYKKSAGPKQMGCISCHDPHDKPAKAAQAILYRDACLKCHQENACTAPLPQRHAPDKQDRCVDCHMATFDVGNVPHVSSTDHRILRKPAPRGKRKPPGPPGPAEELVSILPHGPAADPAEAKRDRALAEALFNLDGRRLAKPHFEDLAEAARRDPGDLLVRAQYALGLIQRKQADQALALAQDILVRQPDYAWGLLAHAIACTELGKYEESAASYRRLIEFAPTHGGYREGLIEQYAAEWNWHEAAAHAQAWIQFDPGRPAPRGMLRDILLQLGDSTEAQKQHRLYEILETRQQAAIEKMKQGK